MMEKSCIIVGAGDFCETDLKVKDGDFIIAADAGVKYLSALNMSPNLIIGDFDSLAGQGEQAPCGDNVIRLSCIKDDTDMLAAVREGMARGYRFYRLYGGTGGRIDHTLANLQTLAFLNAAGMRGYLYDGSNVLTIIENEELYIPAQQKGYFSVFSYGEAARGVSLSGLKYSADNVDLTNSFPLGVSNEFTGKDASVKVKRGKLLAVMPYAAAEVAVIRGIH